MGCLINSWILRRIAYFVGCAVAALPAAAAPLPNAAHVIDYAVVDQELRDVLTGIADELGLHAVVSEAVHGRVRGRLSPAPAAAMLDRLAHIYGFDWYCVGDTIHVSASSEAAARILPLGAVDAALLLRTLDELGISDAHWRPQVSADGALLMASGPPRYLALVDAALAALSKRGQAGAGTQVFRGHARSPF